MEIQLGKLNQIGSKDKLCTQMQNIKMNTDKNRIEWFIFLLHRLARK